MPSPSEFKELDDITQQLKAVAKTGDLAAYSALFPMFEKIERAYRQSGDNAKFIRVRESCRDIFFSIVKGGNVGIFKNFLTFATDDAEHAAIWSGLKFNGDQFALLLALIKNKNNALLNELQLSGHARPSVWKSIVAYEWETRERKQADVIAELAFAFVTSENDETIKLSFGFEKGRPYYFYNNARAFHLALHLGKGIFLDKFLQDETILANIAAYFSSALVGGNSTIIERFLAFPQVLNSLKPSLLTAAVASGKLDVVDRMLQFKEIADNPAVNHNAALMEALRGEVSLPIIDRLLKFSKVRENINHDIIKEAISTQSIEIVDRLLEIDGIKDAITLNNNEALKIAAQNGYVDICKRLLEIPDVQIEFTRSGEAIKDFLKEDVKKHVINKDAVMALLDTMPTMDAKTILQHKLTDYINRVESHSKTRAKLKAIDENDIKFDYGFSWFSQHQAANRKANYHLAKKLLSELKEGKDIATVFSDENIRSLRKDASYHLSFFNHFASSDLKVIIDAARQIKPGAPLPSITLQRNK